MLKKENRLKKKKDFDAIFKERKFLRSFLFLFFFKKNNLNYSRFGIVISKKISKKAVLRNRIKRRIREIIRKNIDKTVVGYDVIIIPFKEIIKKSFQEIEEAIIDGFKKFKH